MSNWLSNLDDDELKYMAPVLFIFDNDAEAAAQYLYREGYPLPVAGAGEKEKYIERSRRELAERPPKKYWEQVKTEIRILLCTDDPKYDELRAKLNLAGAKSTEIVVGTISAAVASVLGLEAGIISAFVAVVLHSVLKLGISAYCALDEQST